MSSHNHGHAHTHGHHGYQHGHQHSHSHSHAPSGLKALLTVLIFTSIIFVVELVGGIISGSLALMGDAMHMLSDSTGLVVAAVAMAWGRKKSSHTATYGYKRVEVVAAMFNAIAVTAISVWIVIEAVQRFRAHEEVDTQIMLIIGTIGLVANIFGALVLHGHRDESMNIEGAFLHVLVDLFGSVAVIAAALIMHFTGFEAADTIASLIIAALILPRSTALLRQALTVLLERVPEGVDVADIERQLCDLEGVQAIHDLHVWSLDGNSLLATAHVVIDDGVEVFGSNCVVLDRAQEVLHNNGIYHSTIQLESTDHADHETVCEPN